MKYKILLFLLAMSFILVSSSCGGDDGGITPCSTAYATELQDEVNALNAAAQAYSTNPTTANCNAYKSAAQSYVNALEPYGNCATLTGQSRTNWQASLDAAKAAVAAIQC
ncbi:MAG: hypothetical protein IPN29_14980 [Saprospiraceae bacterium]|nr:hypothetical protein [Saprospiraceae bacterium]